MKIQPFSFFISTETTVGAHNPIGDNNICVLSDLHIEFIVQSVQHKQQDEFICIWSMCWNIFHLFLAVPLTRQWSFSLQVQIKNNPNKQNIPTCFFLVQSLLFHLTIQPPGLGWRMHGAAHGASWLCGSAKRQCLRAKTWIRVLLSWSGPGHTSEIETSLLVLHLGCCPCSVFPLRCLLFPVATNSPHAFQPLSQEDPLPPPPKVSPQ